MSEPIKCDICGAPATIHLTQIIDGNVRKIHLCEKCAAKHDAADLPILKFAEMLTKKILKESIKGNFDSEQHAGKMCPACGMTDLIFQKTQRFCCAECYKTFAAELEKMLPEIQDATLYLGAGNCEQKLSKRRDKSSTAKDPVAALSIDQLKELLANAVAHEDYALAAKTRDILRSREKRTGRKTVSEVSAKNKKTPNSDKRGKVIDPGAGGGKRKSAGNPKRNGGTAQ